MMNVYQNNDSDVVSIVWQLSAEAKIMLSAEDSSCPVFKLHTAIEDGNIEFARHLLSSGVDIHAPNHSGYTCLHIAVIYGHADVCKELLVRGADANAPEECRVTPLHWASYAGDMSLISPLIKYGANVNACSDDGRRPLLTSALHGHVRASLALLQAGAKINAVDPTGRTSLMLSASRGHMETVRLLLLFGADASYTDAKGMTAHDHARTGKHDSILDILLNTSLHVSESKKGTFGGRVLASHESSDSDPRRSTMPEFRSRRFSLSENSMTGPSRDDSWQQHMQEVYNRASKEIIGDLFYRLDTFQKDHMRKKMKDQLVLNQATS
eukprot:CAMPEP_0114252760 /NCGR_PEP_ID=MMETSP0058-20121206/16016_1 /TAXON_ID=36894 /ORGANISM="Pyramimonas parkeae, CCMP726" /LENGTH=324 /DNA_ID=CAMNT_0001366731 /DNA_START=128 /DNA_END=1102 /DNA_ORIENTATION=+